MNIDCMGLYKKPVVLLLSGGLDSTVLLFDLIQQNCSVHCVLFDYGQTHANRELPIARWFCSLTGTPFTEIKIPKLGGSILTDGLGTKVVPNRNAIFISIAISIAAKATAEAVCFACNKDDSSDFPDCRREFVKAMNEASKASGSNVEVCAPYIDLTKREIVGIGKRFGVPMNETWSCYQGDPKECGVCDACIKRTEALA